MLRRQGVYGETLPVKRNLSVEGSNFLVAGMVGQFERKYNKSFGVKSPEEVIEIFGENSISSYYGWDAVNGFFANLAGVNAELFISSLVGNTGSAIDAVVASATLNDTDSTPEGIITLKAAYAEELEYGESGNRTGYTVELGDRFTTSANGAGTASDTFAVLDSVAGIKVGDIVKFSLTGGAPVTVYKKILTINESTGRITFTGAIHATSNLADGDIVTVPGFRVHVWRKDSKGVVSEKDVELGKVFMTTEPEVVDFYAPNVFASSKWLALIINTTTSAIDNKMPAAVSTLAYLSGGANGTSPTTAAHWAMALANLNDDPVRMIFNPETTDITIQKAIETYCRGRDDLPKVIVNVPEDRTQEQMIVIGNNWQRGDDVLAAVQMNWLKVSDPFSNSSIAPDRNVPSVGHIAGLWIRSIAVNGIHTIPALKSMPIYGCNGVVGDQVKNEIDRTELCEAGVNVIQEVTGYGIILRSFYTPSTDKAYRFANGILMREYIKISAVDSLQTSENTPNSLNRIRNDRSAVLSFLYKLWKVGSNGSVPEGETFGQTADTEGNVSKPEDHFSVQADIINNPQASIEAGERNIDIYFTYPAPAASIKIGVGIMLKG